VATVHQIFRCCSVSRQVWYDDGSSVTAQCNGPLLFGLEVARHAKQLQAVSSLLPIAPCNCALSSHSQVFVRHLPCCDVSAVLCCVCTGVLYAGVGAWLVR
jgi:hypothetical protein